jgi:hypothetical protein
MSGDIQIQLLVLLLPCTGMTLYVGAYDITHTEALGQLLIM